MKQILNLTARPDRFLKPVRSLLLLLLLCFQPLAFADLNTGLVAYWSFDDCTAKDRNNQLNGTLQGSPSCVIGKLGKAFSFNSDNGNGQYIALPTIGAVFNSGISICAWVKFSNSNRTWERIIDIGNGGAVDDIDFARVANSDDLSFYSFDSYQNYSTIHAPNAITNGQWKFYCSTQNTQTSTAAIYVDGKIVNQLNNHRLKTGGFKLTTESRDTRRLTTCLKVQFQSFG